MQAQDVQPVETLNEAPEASTVQYDFNLNEIAVPQPDSSQLDAYERVELDSFVCNGQPVDLDKPREFLVMGHRLGKGSFVSVELVYPYVKVNDVITFSRPMALSVRQYNNDPKTGRLIAENKQAALQAMRNANNYFSQLHTPGQPVFYSSKSQIVEPKPGEPFCMDSEFGLSEKRKFHAAMSLLPGVSGDAFLNTQYTQNNLQARVRFLEACFKEYQRFVDKFPGMTHGDIKPSNFLYDPVTNQAYLIDFDGMGNEFGGQPVTLPYTSPGYFVDNPGTSDDYYSLGLMACEVLGGKNSEAWRAHLERREKLVKLREQSKEIEVFEAREKEREKKRMDEHCAKFSEPRRKDEKPALTEARQKSLEAMSGRRNKAIFEKLEEFSKFPKKLEALIFTPHYRALLKIPAKKRFSSRYMKPLLEQDARMFDSIRSEVFNASSEAAIQVALTTLLSFDYAVEPVLAKENRALAAEEVDAEEYRSCLKVMKKSWLSNSRAGAVEVEEEKDIPVNPDSKSKAFALLIGTLSNIETCEVDAAAVPVVEASEASPDMLVEQKRHKKLKQFLLTGFQKRISDDGRYTEDGSCSETFQRIHTLLREPEETKTTVTKFNDIYETLHKGQYAPDFLTPWKANVESAWIKKYLKEFEEFAATCGFVLNAQVMDADKASRSVKIGRMYCEMTSGDERIDPDFAFMKFLGFSAKDKRMRLSGIGLYDTGFKKTLALLSFLLFELHSMIFNVVTTLGTFIEFIPYYLMRQVLILKNHVHQNYCNPVFSHVLCLPLYAIGFACSLISLICCNFGMRDNKPYQWTWVAIDFVDKVLTTALFVHILLSSVYLVGVVCAIVFSALHLVLCPSDAVKTVHEKTKKLVGSALFGSEKLASVMLYITDFLTICTIAALYAAIVYFAAPLMMSAFSGFASVPVLKAISWPLAKLSGLMGHVFCHLLVAFGKACGFSQLSMAASGAAVYGTQAALANIAVPVTLVAGTKALHHGGFFLKDVKDKFSKGLPEDQLLQTEEKFCL